MNSRLSRSWFRSTGLASLLLGGPWVSPSFGQEAAPAEPKPRAKEVALTLSSVGPDLGFKKSKVIIVSASYGTGGKNADVTAVVRKMIEEKRQMFSVTPSVLGTDPNPGWNKELLVNYRKDGVLRSRHWGENAHVLPETFYGPQNTPELAAWLPGTRWSDGKSEIHFLPNGWLITVGSTAPGRWEAASHNEVNLTLGGRTTLVGMDYTWSTFKLGNDTAALTFKILK